MTNIRRLISVEGSRRDWHEVGRVAAKVRALLHGVSAFVR